MDYNLKKKLFCLVYLHVLLKPVGQVHLMITIHTSISMEEINVIVKK